MAARNVRRSGLVLALLALACDGDDDPARPFPFVRFAGLYELEAEHGSGLPHDHILASGDTVEHHRTTLDVTAEEYLPEALWTDSLVRRERPGNEPVLTNETLRRTLVGFVRGDTVMFREPAAWEVTLFRLVLDAAGNPLRLNEDRVVLDEVWTRR